MFVKITQAKIYVTGSTTGANNTPNWFFKKTDKEKFCMVLSEWATVLETTEKKQGIGQLHGDCGFCCLGILGEARVHNFFEKYSTEADWLTLSDLREIFYGMELIFDPFQKLFAIFNDTEKLTFKEIAGVMKKMVDILQKGETASFEVKSDDGVENYE